MLTHHGFHLTGEAKVKAMRSTSTAAPDEGWLTITLDGQSINIFGTQAQLDELSVKIDQAQTDHHIQLGKSLFSDPTIDWDRATEDDLAMRGAYDDVMAEPWEYR
jgi:hypothetical protein